MFRRVDAGRAGDTDIASLTALAVTVHGGRSKKYLFPIKYPAIIDGTRERPSRTRFGKSSCRSQFRSQDRILRSRDRVIITRCDSTVYTF